MGEAKILSVNMAGLAGMDTNAPYQQGKGFNEFWAEFIDETIPWDSIRVVVDRFTQNVCNNDNRGDKCYSYFYSSESFHPCYTVHMNTPSPLLTFSEAKHLLTSYTSVTQFHPISTPLLPAVTKLYQWYMKSTGMKPAGRSSISRKYDSSCTTFNLDIMATGTAAL